jgi:hypothetical protein
MTQYLAYNKMYYEGKPEGRAYVADSGRTRASATNSAKKGNATWNRWAAKGNSKRRMKLVYVKRRK